MKYQYRVYNENVDTVVTVPCKEEKYAIRHARRCLQDFYGKKDEEVKELKCEFICEFLIESFINVGAFKLHEKKSEKITLGEIAGDIELLQNLGVILPGITTIEDLLKLLNAECKSQIATY